MSSVNLVGSWLLANFSGQTESTEMQVSSLTDTERCHPRDQLLNRWLGETHAQCKRMLAGDVSSAEAIPIGGYRSSN